MKATYLIVPALTDQAGQCRIVRRDHELVPSPGLTDYRRNPDLWREAGHMTSRGRLIALGGAHGEDMNKVWHDMKQDEPLMAGLTYTYDATTWEPA